MAVGGAPPTPALLEGCARAGLDVTPPLRPERVVRAGRLWLAVGVDALPMAEQAARRPRQGVGNVISGRGRVVDSEGADVPADWLALGEIALRGNNVMLGYCRDPAATAAAMPEGCFRTGDLAVMHPDGYLEIRDRAKDVIISGGENISSVEVEAALATHPAVLEAAVAAVPDEHWGERPVAWVTVRPGHQVSAEKLDRHVRARLAGFKAPR